MNTTDSLAMAAQYQSYIIILTAFGMAVLAMLAAAVVLVYNAFKRYPHIMITGGGGSAGNSRNDCIRRRRAGSV